MKNLKPRTKQLIFIEQMFICLILILPFFFYTYNIFPEGVKEVQIFGISISAGILGELDYAIWNLNYKLLILFLLTIWYLTSRQKWRLILLFPIVMEYYKMSALLSEWIFGVRTMYLSQSPNFIFSQSLPLIIVNLFILFTIDKRLKAFKKGQDYINIINGEIISNLVNKTPITTRNYKTTKKELRALRKQKSTMDSKVYLRELIFLRDKLTS